MSPRLQPNLKQKLKHGWQIDANMKFVSNIDNTFLIYRVLCAIKLFIINKKIIKNHQSTKLHQINFLIVHNFFTFYSI